MISILLISLVSLADDTLVRPSPPEPVPNECHRSTSFSIGYPPPTMVVSPDGIVLCTGILEPTSSLAYLLAVEKYSTGRDAICAIDIQRLTDERDWYQTRYNQLNQPESFWKKPSSQRWLGRLEAIGVISILTGGIVAVYSSASGK